MRVLLLSSCLFVGGLAHAANDLPGGGIDPQALSRHVRVLASDEFEGRAPATEGEERTVQYLIEQFRSYGLQAAWMAAGCSRSRWCARSWTARPRPACR
jgi:hypothetical protein